MRIFIEICILAGLNLLFSVWLQKKLVVKYAAMRQQLIVYKRTVKKPKIKNRDRLFWILLSKFIRDWKSLLVIVKPETVIKWNQQRFKRYWRNISKPKGNPGRPKIPEEHIDWIRRISSDHPEYSAERIAGILKVNFGVVHAKSTVEKYRVKTNRRPGGSQRWQTFIKNHASAIWSCDFLVQFTFFFTPVYVFVILKVKNRKIIWFNVTTQPTLAWVKQQVRNATPFANTPRFLIHDNDGIFCQHKRAVINQKTGRTNTYRSSFDFWLSEVMDIKGIPIPYGAPNANSHCERFLQTLRRECLNKNQ